MPTGRARTQNRTRRGRISSRAWAEAVAKALSHPDRSQILRTVERDGTTSTSEIAEKTARSLPQLSYHVRELKSAGLLRRARTRQVRGAIETFYELTATGTAALKAVEAVTRL